MLQVINPIPAEQYRTVQSRGGTFSLAEFKVMRKRFAEMMKLANAKPGARTVSRNPNSPKLQDRYNATRLWLFFRLISDTGMRASEAMGVKWGMLQLHERSGGGEETKYYTAIDLPWDVVKSKNTGRFGRRVWSFDEHRLHERFMKWKAVLNEHFELKFGRTVTDEDFVFPQYLDPSKKAPMNQAFSYFIKKIGLKKCPRTGQTRSAGGLRKMYINQRLSNKVPITSVALNTGHSIQTLISHYEQRTADQVVGHLTLRELDQVRFDLVSKGIV
jgi:integrase